MELLEKPTVLPSSKDVLQTMKKKNWNNIVFDSEQLQIDVLCD